MKLFDRYLLKEFLKFILLALAAVVVIYILIDLFEELSYFMSRRVPLFTLVLYYVYFAPSAIDLLYPVSFVLACFMVYGQLTRQRELAALQCAGINTYRLFQPILLFGVVSVSLIYLGHDYVTIPCATALDNLKRFTIEKRTPPGATTRRDMYYLADDGRVFYAAQFETQGIMRDFIIVSFDSTRRHMTERVDGVEADWRDGQWFAKGVNVRRFPSDTTEVLTKYDTLPLVGVTETPGDFSVEARPVEQMPVPDLKRYADRMHRAGYRVDKELVELNYRYSYPWTGLILLIMALPLAVQLRRGGVMLGLGLGLLFSFLFWCAIQGARAFGQTGTLSPVLAAWLPNAFFLLAAMTLLPTVRR